MVDAPQTPPRQLSDLKPKMKLEGTVTKVEMVGAFIDVGVGQPGLVHISMLAQGQVNRVEDVLQPGQKVQVWVHRVDVARGRLELTMIPPVLLEWKDLRPGLRARGKVVRVEPFGAFVDVGAERAGLVHVSEMSKEYVKDPAQIVKPGDEVEVVVLEIDRKKRQLRLSLKAAEAEPRVEAEAEPEVAIPTPMERALRAAMQESTPEQPAPSAEPRPKGKRRGAQEDILTRTLQTRVRTSTPGQS